MRRADSVHAYIVLMVVAPFTAHSFRATMEDTRFTSDKLCNSADVKAACAVLGGINETSADTIAAALYAAPGNVAEYLKDVGFLPDQQGNIDCHTLCAATCAAAPRLLGVQLPKKSGRACTDAACDEEFLVNNDMFRNAGPLSQQPHTDDLRKVASAEEAKVKDFEPWDVAFLEYNTPDLVRIIAGFFNVFLAPQVSAEKRLAKKFAKRWRDYVKAKKNERQGSSFVELPPLLGEHMAAWKGEEGKQTIEFAALEGHVWLSAALLRFGNARPYVEKWFGRFDAATKEIVRKMLFRMLHAIGNLYLKRAFDCGDSTLAYVIVNSEEKFRQSGEKIWVVSPEDGEAKHKFVVNICPSWWDVHDDPSYFYGTLVHEVAHHFGPTDVETTDGVAYGPYAAAKLARQDPDEAMNNADNYMQFVHDVARNADVLEEGPVDPIPRTCEVRGTPFPVSTMCRRLSSMDGCDHDYSIKPHTTFQFKPFTPACYPFCKVVELVLNRDGFQDCGSKAFENAVNKEMRGAKWQEWGEISKKNPVVNVPGDDGTYAGGGNNEYYGGDGNNEHYAEGTCTFKDKPMTQNAMCTRMKRHDGDCDIVAAELDEDTYMRFDGDCLSYCKSIKETCMPSASPVVDPPTNKGPHSPEVAPPTNKGPHSPEVAPPTNKGPHSPEVAPPTNKGPHSPEVAPPTNKGPHVGGGNNKQTCTLNGAPIPRDAMCSLLEIVGGQCDFAVEELEEDYSVSISGDCRGFCKSIKSTCTPFASNDEGGHATQNPAPEDWQTDRCTFRGSPFKEIAMCTRLDNSGDGHCSEVYYGPAFTGNCDAFCAYVQPNCVKGKYNGK